MRDLLVTSNLYLYYRTMRGLVKAVDDISFSLHKGETLAIIGESGCGKSSLAKAILRLLPRNTGLYKGSIFLENEDIAKLEESEFRKKVLWKKIAIVPQASMNALNPVLKIVDQVIEPLTVDGEVTRDVAEKNAVELFKYIGIPVEFLHRYPFELSGGMRQRVCIAMALIANPSIVILDEPTSALDVLTQANIMNLLKQLKKERNLSYIFITHDIALSSELADNVGVMYAGKLVEVSPADEFFNEPKHPYAKLLLSSVPVIRKESKLSTIPGTPPSLINPPPGCRFHPRCPYAVEKCRKEEPPIINIGSSITIRCWLYG
ncbi:MAG: ABC transporter ATP-binding protein [Thermofilaceae archaeon]